MRSAHALIEKLRRSALERRQRALQASSEHRVFVPIAPVRQPEDDWHRRIQYRPDTRTMTGRLLGDPRPGRAAIDIGAMKP